MPPILRLSIPCGRAGHQSADLAPAPRPQRHAPGYHPYDGGRYRAGERISTGFVESTVNQVVSKRMVKKQQMQWTPRGAHLLLQIRTRVLNDEWKETFRTWYPGFRSPTPRMAA